ncbi:MAG TPA: type 3 dihydrofolate reductase [Anaerolineae bacterium]|nr:type 3 dihydrofolate reductase [Anaerolineae bacterium]
MKISLIAALARHRIIGYKGTIPWQLPADLRYFKKQTLHKPIIMGRKTYQSIGKPLPQRHNIIVTRQHNFPTPDNCTIVSTPLDALAAVPEDTAEVMVIGGADIYAWMLPRADRLYLTYIDIEVPGDTLFPAIDWSQWRQISREEHTADDKNHYDYAFVIYERK